MILTDPKTVPGTVFALALLGGCAGGLKAGDAQSPTGGVAIEVLVTDERSSHALYRVDSDGMISFGGGFDALQDRTTWAAAMTPEQIDTLQALLEEHEWFEGPPLGSDSPGLDAEGDRQAAEPVHKIRFDSLAGGWRATIHGRASHLDPIVEFLREIAQARHDELLNSFPQPNQPESGDE